jgi:RNA recognition motif-containing protein
LEGKTDFHHNLLQSRSNSMNIYVGNLSRGATSDDLRETFEAFGEVESTHVVKDRFTGESRGFGFVEMPSKEEAQEAINNLNGKEFMGQEIKVSEARPRKDQRGGGGRGGRRGGREGGYGGGRRY